MNKIILTIIFSICFILSNANAMTTTEYVNAIENKMFGTTYENQTLDKRIDRIELQIYDKSYSGSNEERLEKIDKIYPKKDFEIDTIRQNQLTQKDFNNKGYKEQLEAVDYNDYPIVNEIENSIYQRNYSGEDIYKRLSRIETELYGNVKSDMNLQERVENLKSILPKKSPNRITANDYGFRAPIDYDNSSNAYFESNSAIGKIELETFNRTFSNDNMKRRIERLEQFYFGDIATDKTNEDRVTRLASIVTSNKSFNTKSEATAQWAGILVNLLMIGLGFLL